MITYQNQNHIHKIQDIFEDYINNLSPIQNLAYPKKIFIAMYWFIKAECNINGVEITSHQTIQHQQNKKRKSSQ